MSWIIVTNWERFQSYRADREPPPWIKLYTELQTRDAWCRLTLAERGLLVSIWIAYAHTNGVLSTELLPSFVTASSRHRQLDSLQEAGFLTVSDNQPSRARRRAPTREVEGETEGEKKITKRKDGKSRRKAEAWIDNGLASMVPPEALADVISDEFGITEPELLYELTQRAIQRKANA